MTLIDEAFPAAQVRLISDEAYLSVFRSLTRRARYRCLCSLFIVDLTPARDAELLVDSMLIDLQAAVWLGVDVRLLIGGSRSNLEIAHVALTAQRRTRQIGVPVRLLEAANIRGSHTKLVIVDDHVLTGSHNWSAGAFTSQTQDSVLVHAPALAEALASTFEHQWERTQPQKAG